MVELKWSTPTAGPAEESQFLSWCLHFSDWSLESCTLSFSYVLLVACHHQSWPIPYSVEKCPRTCRCIIIATSDCRYKRSDRRRCEVKVPFHLCLCSLSLTPIGRSSLTSSFHVASILQVRMPQGLVEHPAGTVKSLRVRKSPIFFSEFTSLCHHTVILLDPLPREQSVSCSTTIHFYWNRITNWTAAAWHGHNRMC